MPITNKVQLMTYPDSLGGDLSSLKEILDTYLSKAIGFLHILPPYPSSADRGFSPLTHLEIDPNWGDWKDIQNLGQNYELMLDVIAGHVSDQSYYFLDYLSNGSKSKFYEMFNRVEKVFSDQKMGLDELTRFDYLGPILPMVKIKLKNGEEKMHFKTFMPYQVDLDITSEVTKKILAEYIKNHAQKGIKMIRLDAVDTLRKNRNLGYNTVPEVYDEIQWLFDQVHGNGMEALCELFGTIEEIERIINMGGYLYDYSLAEAIFYSLFTIEAATLVKHFQRFYPYRKNLITHITNHDGLLIGRKSPILSPDQVIFTQNKIFQNAGESTQKASGLGSNNIDVARINGTLMEAFCRDQKSWLIAQSLVLFAPGTPQIYYNDLLGQRNDEELYEQTGEGRSLVRHNHSSKKIKQKFEQPFVQDFIKIMEIRNSNPAFDGEMDINSPNPSSIKVTWQNKGNKVSAIFDLAKKNIKIKIFANDDHLVEELDY